MGMHAVSIEGPDGSRRSLVLRRYNDYLRANDPRACEREWKTLEILARAGIGAPRPLWLDAEGRVFGRPAMTLTLMAGRTTLLFRDREIWIGDLAAALVRLHSADFAGFDLTFLPRSSSNVERMIHNGPRPEAVARFPRTTALWERLAALWQLRAPLPAILVHGDYWPGNTVWRRGRMVGIIDWEEPRLSEPGEDVAYCRMDLALSIGDSAPDEFLDAYERVAGRGVQNLPMWDLVAATRPLPDPAVWLPGYKDLARGRTDLTAGLLRRRLARWIDRAIARAG
jgi:aminoglycoside phosphotransferase (APT) family kinase protein